MMQKYQDSSLSPEERASDLLARMNLDEKFGQIQCYNAIDSFLGKSVEKQNPYGVGQVCILIATMLDDVGSAAGLITRLQKQIMESGKHHIPAIFHIETLTGVMVTAATSFPCGLGQASTWDPEQQQKMAACIARQGRAMGISHALAPVFDICRDPRFGRMGETYGEDPTLAAAMGTAYVKGLQDKHRMSACSKHFLGFMAGQGGIHTAQAVVSPRELREVYYQNKVCVVTGAASGIGKALCEKLVALGAQVYALDRNKADIEGLSAFVETDLSDKGSIDAAFGVLPQVIDRFFGVAGLSGARTSYWLTFTVNFIANKYMTDTYLEKRIPSGGSIAYVTSCGGLMWEKWRKEYVKVMDCKTWDEMVAFMKSVSPKDGVGVMAYTLSKRAMNYYTSLKAVELGKRGIRVNALLPGSTDTGMKKEFEKMAGGQDNLVKENGGAGRLATPQEMADPLLFLNSDMAAFVSGLLLIADMGHNCEKTLGFCKNQLDVPAALKLYNTKFFQNKLKTNQ